MAEGSPKDCPHMNCYFTEDDVNAVVLQIMEVASIRDPDRISKLTVMVPVKIFTSKNEVVLRYFFSEMERLQDERLITWATQGEVLDACMQAK